MNTHTETYRRNAFADTGISAHADPITLTVLARRRRGEELARLTRAFAAWAAGRTLAWHRRAAVRRQLSALPDYFLADMGIRRDQIADIAAGRIKRPQTALETAVAMPELSFLGAKPRGGESGPAVATTLAA